MSQYPPPTPIVPHGESGNTGVFNPFGLPNNGRGSMAGKKPQTQTQTGKGKRTRRHHKKEKRSTKNKKRSLRSRRH